MSSTVDCARGMSGAEKAPLGAPFGCMLTVVLSLGRKGPCRLRPPSPHLPTVPAEPGLPFPSPLAPVSGSHFLEANPASLVAGWLHVLLCPGDAARRHPPPPPPRLLRGLGKVAAGTAGFRGCLSATCTPGAPRASPLKRGKDFPAKVEGPVAQSRASAVRLGRPAFRRPSSSSSRLRTSEITKLKWAAAQTLPPPR